MADNPFDSVPDIEFFHCDPDAMVAQMVDDYEAAMEEATGEPFTLPVASRERIFIQAQAMRLCQLIEQANYLCKMNLFKYSEGDYLDHLFAPFGVERLEPAKAVSTQRFALSAMQSTAITIPIGTRVRTGDAIFFRTTRALVIPAGEVEGTAPIEAVEEGEQANGFAPGEVHVLVDPVPFVAETANIEPTQGGADIESDDRMKSRGYYVLQGPSTAGSPDAYQYHIRAYSQAIEDVEVANPEPGVVEITLSLTDGEEPGTAFIEGLLAHLEDGRRPMTDSVTVRGPEVVPYDLTATYYIARSDQAKQTGIEEAAGEAMVAYIAWQDGKIGRDLNPDKLVGLLMAAGVKRVEISGVAFTPIEARQACRFSGDIADALKFGGIEDD